MKKILFYTALISICTLTSSFIEVSNNCDIKALKNELKSELKPDFKYDSSNINQFTLEAKKQGTEVHVPLFSSEKYKLLFNTAGLPSDFEIQIYNKKFGSKNRTLLYSIKGSESIGKHIFSFEPEEPKAMYIDYLLPASEEKNITGCIVFLMGYKIG
jgi:hypothetical protein